MEENIQEKKEEMTLDALALMIKAGFDDVEARLGGRIDGVETSLTNRMDGLEKKITDLSENMDSKFEGVHRRLDDLVDKLGNHEERIVKLETEMVA